MRRPPSHHGRDHTTTGPFGAQMRVAMTSRSYILSFAFVVSTSLLMAGCAGSDRSIRGDATQASRHSQPVEQPRMPNPVNYFEIPVTDMARAMQFYQRVLLVDFELTQIDGHPMALFPYDKNAPGITGALASGESYRPGRQGVRIYFTVTDIDATLRRAVEAGGQVLYPKTSIGEHGHVAEFEDSEGNCIAIRTPAQDV